MPRLPSPRPPPRPAPLPDHYHVSVSGNERAAPSLDHGRQSGVGSDPVACNMTSGFRVENLETLSCKPAQGAALRAGNGRIDFEEFASMMTAGNESFMQSKSTMRCGWHGGSKLLIGLCIRPQEGAIAGCLLPALASQTGLP